MAGDGRVGSTQAGGRGEGVAAPVTGLSHVQLLVRDLAASAQWYATVLGLEPFAGSAAAGYVALRHRRAGFAVVLSPRADTPAAGAAATGPLDHLAFAVPDGDTLAAWAEHLRAAGIEHPGVVDELGKPSLQLRDPDGNAVELVAAAPR